jgi:hypothetical protein
MLQLVTKTSSFYSCFSKLTYNKIIQTECNFLQDFTIYYLEFLILLGGVLYFQIKLFALILLNNNLVISPGRGMV